MDLVTGVDEYLKSGFLPYYYALVVMGAIFLFYQFGLNKYSFFIILIFWEGVFAYWGQVSNLPIHNIYKIGIFLYALVVFGLNIFKKESRIENFVNFSFFVFTVSFWTSAILNNQEFMMVASQYGKKFAVPYLFYHGIKNLKLFPLRAEYLSKLFLYILILQIVFSGFKVIILGFGEAVVGSMSYKGGAPANIIPVLGFIFIWIYRSGKLGRKDWWFIVSLVFISIVSNKRSVVFMLPVMIIFILVFVQRSVKLVSLIKYVPIAIVVFYLGIITNPTLNREGNRWGSFDVSYAFNYAMDYTFGTEKQREKENVGYGRGGGFKEALVIGSATFNTANYYFGHGLSEFVTKSYEDFDYKKYGLAYKGSAGGATGNFIALGLIGMITIYLFGISLIFTIRSKKFRWVILGFFTFEYILLGNSLLIFGAHSLLLVFCIIYFNIKLNHKLF
jgi:hypothetical protein